MDRNIIAISDILRHKDLGIISHQPGRIGSDFYPKEENSIYVRDMGFILYTVSADDCEPSTLKEKEEYWKRNGI